MNRSEVLSILHEHRQELEEGYQVASLSLFGSVARDEARPDGDIDLLVEFTQPVGLFDFITLQQRLEALFGCKVDLGTPRSLKLSIKDRVLQEAVRVS
ncbi:MAG: nucleotidyltransferase family protein [Chloroflexi bacterium]|nr:nucleotidyltransferase family protein [Chloroflexota bacterium]